MLGTQETSAYAIIANQKIRSTQPTTIQALHEREVTAAIFAATPRFACARARSYLRLASTLSGTPVKYGVGSIGLPSSIT